MDALTTQGYESRFIPKIIAENSFSVEAEHYSKYQKEYLTKQKCLEIQVLRENKNQEVLQKIVSESQMDRSRKQVRE